MSSLAVEEFPIIAELLYRDTFVYYLELDCNR